MKHTVKKNMQNRIAMRILACIFMLVAFASFAAKMTSENQSGRMLVLVLCACCLTYGIYLIRQTFKPQAYDITYIFGDKEMILQLHKKEIKVSYGEIVDLGYVVPNPNMDYSIIQIYIGKEQYVIPFMEKSNVGEALYGMLQLKKEEAERTEAE
ncbi:MAG: hypothetical protein K2I10_10720 [Lachnospiraceae bacterium]|nr:hypothetical protein [Lachnospiraceae bacterium]